LFSVFSRIAIMPPPTPTLLGHLRRLIAPTVSDTALLARWVERRDEAAFAALMARHGPMVLGVCRRVLGDVQHAEDVFQATFLVLSRKAANVRRPEALAGFLYGIALRLARKARRRFVPTQSDIPEPVDPHPHPLDAITGRELLALLDEEIARLPEVFRLPLLLCVMQGRSVEEAARLLGWSHGSVRGRLARGRERLRERLTRRGLSVSVGALALSAPVAVPERLLAETIRHLAAPAPSVSTLAAGSIGTLKLKAVCLGLSVLAMAGLGASLAFVPASEPEAPSAATPPAQAKDEPRRDRYGDPLPLGAVARLGTLRFRAPGEIRALAFAPDGKTLAVSSPGGLILMDAVSGQRLRRLPPSDSGRGGDRLLIFAPDGKRLAGVSHPSVVNNRIKVVMHVGELSGEWRPKDYDAEHALWLGWSAEGEPLAVCLEKEAVCLRELTGGRSRRFACKDLPEFRGEFFNVACACSPRGRVLAVADERGAIHVWDTATGRERCTLQPRGDPVYRLVVSSDGSKLISHTPQTVQVWDVAAARLMYALDAKDNYPACLSEDGQTLAVGTPVGTIRLLDTASGREQGHLQGEVSLDTSFSPDGKWLATVGRAGNAIQLLHVATGRRKSEPMGHTSQPFDISFAPDGRRVATGGSFDGTFRIWDARTGEPLVHLRQPGMAAGCAFSADGRSLFASWSSGQPAVYDVATGQRRHVFTLEDPDRPDSSLSILHMYPADDGETLFAFSYPAKKNSPAPLYPETLITGWDTSARKQIFRRKRQGELPTFVLSADIRVLAIPHPWGLRMREKDIATGPMRLEDVKTGKLLVTFLTLKGKTWPVGFSPDGRLLASNTHLAERDTATNTLRLWETATAAEVLSLPAADYLRVGFSRDGRLLAAAVPSQEILVWDLAHGRELRRFKGFDAEVMNLAFSPDGRRLISGLGDSTLLVWDVESDEMPRTSKLGSEAVSKAWSDLAGSDAARAYRARWKLAIAPEETLPLIKERLHPAQPADPQQLRRLLDDLASEQFAVREKAQTELEKLGDLAEPALRQALASKPTLEVRRRILAVLERLRGPVTRPETLRALRAVAVLEDIATPTARRLLEELSKGTPEARLTREAKASLRRLDLRTASAR
jgi:RNA polymerase sigma factor (sigma-70 family)